MVPGQSGELIRGEIRINLLGKPLKIFADDSIQCCVASLRIRLRPCEQLRISGERNIHDDTMHWIITCPPA